MLTMILTLSNKSKSVTTVLTKAISMVIKCTSTKLYNIHGNVILIYAKKNTSLIESYYD